MTALIAAAVVFACAMAGALVGLKLRDALPSHHLSAETKDVINITTGLVATLAALVLGLLVASAMDSFDAEEDGFQKLSANIIVLDRLLSGLGPDAAPARERLRSVVSVALSRLWPTDGAPAGALDEGRITAGGRSVFAAILAVKPPGEDLRHVHNQALEIATELARTRWLLSEPAESASLFPFLVVVTFWLAMIFASFGLFAPRNAIVMTALVIGAFSAAGAVFLIVDLNRPIGGLIQVTSDPLRFALEQMGK